MIYLRERDSAVLSLITAHESACDCCGWVFRRSVEAREMVSLWQTRAARIFLSAQIPSRWDSLGASMTPTAGKLPAVGSNVGCLPHADLKLA